jgi:hypothetical protein
LRSDLDAKDFSGVESRGENGSESRGESRAESRGESRGENISVTPLDLCDEGLLAVLEPHLVKARVGRGKALPMLAEFLDPQPLPLASTSQGIKTPTHTKLAPVLSFPASSAPPSAPISPYDYRSDPARQEVRLAYNESAYPIADTFAHAIGLTADDLPRLHEHIAALAEADGYTYILYINICTPLQL